MHPPAFPHDALREVYPGVYLYLLHGSIKMGPRLGTNIDPLGKCSERS